MYKTSIWWKTENMKVYSGSIRWAWEWAWRSIRNGANEVIIHTPAGKKIRVW